MKLVPNNSIGLEISQRHTLESFLRSPEAGELADRLLLLALVERVVTYKHIQNLMQNMFKTANIINFSIVFNANFFRYKDYLQL